MVSYTPFDVRRQNEGVAYFAAQFQGMSNSALVEAFTYGAIVEAVQLVNRSTSNRLTHLHGMLEKTHGKAGVGAVGTVLTAALVRALGVDVEICARGGDFKLLSSGTTKEQKTSFRELRPSQLGERKLAGMPVSFSDSQLRAHSPKHMSWLGFDVVDDHNARPYFMHAPIARISGLRDTSRQDGKGKYTFQVPYQANGTFSTRGLVGITLKPFLCPDVSTYQLQTAQVW